MNEKITCIAQIIAKKECSKQLKQALNKLIQPTRDEEGCLSYSLYCNTEDTNKFTMIEEFKSKEAFDFHSKQPYLEGFKKSAGVFIESVSIDLYKKI